MTTILSAFPPSSTSLQESLDLKGKNQFSLLFQEEETSSKEESEEEEEVNEKANGVERGSLNRKAKKSSKKKKNLNLKQQHQRDERALAEAIKDNKRIANDKERQERMEAKRCPKERKERGTANGTKKVSDQKGNNSEEGVASPAKVNKTRSKGTPSKDNQSSTQEADGRSPKGKEEGEETAAESNKDDQKHDGTEGGQTPEEEEETTEGECLLLKAIRLDVPTYQSMEETEKVGETGKTGGPLKDTAPTSLGSTDLKNNYALFNGKMSEAKSDSESVSKQHATKPAKKKTTKKMGKGKGSQ